MVQERERVIVDANVLYSTLYKPEGVCGNMIQATIEGSCQLLSTDSVREEVRRNLVENLSLSEREEARLVLALPVEWVPREAYEHRINEAVLLLAHEADAPVLALSLAARHTILSGDRHFRSEPVMNKVRVLTSGQFLKTLPRR